MPGYDPSGESKLSLISGRAIRKKPYDEQLIKLLRGSDQKKAELALRELRARYRDKVELYIKRLIPIEFKDYWEYDTTISENWVIDETWKEFENYVQTKDYRGSELSVQTLLYLIAMTKYIELLSKWIKRGGVGRHVLPERVQRIVGLLDSSPEELVRDSEAQEIIQGIDNWLRQLGMQEAEPPYSEFESEEEERELQWRLVSLSRLMRLEVDAERTTGLRRQEILLHVNDAREKLGLPTLSFEDEESEAELRIQMLEQAAAEWESYRPRAEAPLRLREEANRLRKKYGLLLPDELQDLVPEE